MLYNLLTINSTEINKIKSASWWQVTSSRRNEDWFFFFFQGNTRWPIC